MSDILKIDSFFQEYLKVTGKRWNDAPTAEKRMREKKWPDGYIWFKIPVNDKAEAELSPMNTGAKNSEGREVTQKVTTRGETEWLCYYLHTGPEVSPEVHLVGMPTKERIYLMGEAGAGINGEVVLNETCEVLFANREKGIMSFSLDATDYNTMNVGERRIIGDCNPWLNSTYIQQNRDMTVRGRYIADRGNLSECALWTSNGRETAECHEVWPEFIIPFEKSLLYVGFNGDCNGTREKPYKIILPDIPEKEDKK